MPTADSGTRNRPCLVLDAMGVIFKSADDVAELLIPFIAEKSGSHNEAAIQAAYLEVSLGTIEVDEFWNRVGVAAELEDEFLARHSLNAGVIELLEWSRDNHIPVWCLSNDVGRWSRKTRTRLNIEGHLQGAIISSDVGLRKPDPQIYEALIKDSGYQPDNLLFIDDREKNVSAARTLGIESILQGPESNFEDAQHWLLQRANES